MKLALKRPVQILIIGAGGTGGYVIPHLYRIAYASDRKCRIIIADGDIVEGIVIFIVTECSLTTE